MNITEAKTALLEDSHRASSNRFDSLNISKCHQRGMKNVAGLGDLSKTRTLDFGAGDFGEDKR